MRGCVGKQSHLPWDLPAEWACTPVAFESATRTSPVPRYTMPLGGGAAARADLGLEQAIWLWQQDKYGGVIKDRRGKGTGSSHPAIWKDRDSLGGGCVAMSTVHEACAPPLARDGHPVRGVPGANAETIDMEGSQADAVPLDDSSPDISNGDMGRSAPNMAPLSGGGGDKGGTGHIAPANVEAPW